MNPFLTKRILVVTAHPDDESPLAAGTIRQVVDSGGEVRLLCATLGEKGRAHVGESVSFEDLKELRRAELREAAAVLGLSQVYILQFADGQLADSIADFSERIVKEIDAYNPDYVLSFGLDGYTGHSDHVAAYRAAALATGLLGKKLIRFSLPPEPWRSSCVEVLQRKRKFGVYHQPTEEYPEPTIRIHVDEHSKLKAIHCHKTQLEGLDPYKIFTPELARHFLTHEYFIAES